MADETERNKDDVEHCKMLESHYEERGKAYEEVQAAAEDATKELKQREKTQVNLEERKKHATSKEKKVKKLLKEGKAEHEAARGTIETSIEKIAKEKKKHDEFEASLEQEEKILEGIQYSLSGPLAIGRISHSRWLD